MSFIIWQFYLVKRGLFSLKLLFEIVHLSPHLYYTFSTSVPYLQCALSADQYNARLFRYLNSVTLFIIWYKDCVYLLLSLQSVCPSTWVAQKNLKLFHWIWTIWTWTHSILIKKNIAPFYQKKLFTLLSRQEIKCIFSCNFKTFISSSFHEKHYAIWECYYSY